MDADTTVLADREVELAGSAYPGGGSCPGRRFGTIHLPLRHCLKLVHTAMRPAVPREAVICRVAQA